MKTFFKLAMVASVAGLALVACSKNTPPETAPAPAPAPAAAPEPQSAGFTAVETDELPF